MRVYRSPAKINLSLDVLSRREDGYHELQSVVHAVGLFDTLIFDFGIGAGLSLRCSDPALGGDDNLCLKAARRWLEDVRTKRVLRFAGVRITLEKSIPCGAGLGGGSGNAAATLLALNEYFDAPLSDEELHSAAASLGADVPFFSRGGCALLEDVGEKLSHLPALKGAAVLVCPSQHASTPSVYRRFDELGEPSGRSTPSLLDAMRQSTQLGAAMPLGNDLQNAAQSLGIDTETPRALLQKNGALVSQMSGSGAASFGLHQKTSEARKAAEAIRNDAALPAGYEVFAAPLLATGVEKVE